MTDLSTIYMGLPLANPLVPSASPLSRSLDNLRRMEAVSYTHLTLPTKA